MLLDLESLSGIGGEINFMSRKDEVSPFPLKRPSSLYLPSRNSFNPNLPPTPEFISVRNGSFCSLPERPSPTSKSAIIPYAPGSPSSAFDSHSSPKRKNAETIQQDEDAPCCWWMLFRSHRSKKDSTPQRDVAVNFISPQKRKTPNAFLNRRRAATVSQPLSLFGKENKREWGEERHKDVVYAVMLKRIQRAPSPSTTTSDGLQWATQKVRYIKGATLPFLVNQLCQYFVDDWGERNFLAVFLATFRSFSTPAEVLDLIIKEGENLRTESIEKRGTFQRSIVKVLRTWLERYFDEDFFDPPHHLLLKRLQELAEEYHEDEAMNNNLPAITENDCDFVAFVQSKLQSAEVKTFQEEATQSLNSPSNFSDIRDETDNVCVEEESLNMDSSKTFLNLLSPHHVAEQLTVQDAILFLRVVPYHCLQAVRSSKDKPATVKATIDQFNKVVYCVQGTCLCPGLKPSQRAKIICRWIEVAQACRELKNFSSLRAIISGLQTHSIHRLKRTWQQVPQAFLNLLDELAKLNIKDSLRKVGTAKVNTEKSSIVRVRRDATSRRQQAIHSGVMHGTVPYLGSFLTDLTFLHTAKPEYIEKGLINFTKRRKEFELLAQLQLWQASCRSYQRLEPDGHFSLWFHSVTLPTDEQAIQLSEEIEPPNSCPLSPAPSTPVMSNHNGCLDSSGNSSSSLPFTNLKTLSNDLNDMRISESESNSASKANGNLTVDAACVETRTINVQIVKKSFSETDTDYQDSKEMKLCSNDRSPAFIKKAFGVFEVNEQDVQNFSLVQILPDDKELVIPENGNVYYAMNSSMAEYRFVLLEDGAELPQKRQERTHTLPTPNKRKKRSRKQISSTSSMSSSMSPIKNLYRHLGVTRGSYSPTTEEQKIPDRVPEEPELVEIRQTPDVSRRKKSADDDISMCSMATSSGRRTSASSSGDESDSSGFGKVWRLMTRGKGHRRNLSDSAQFNRDVFTSVGDAEKQGAVPRDVVCHPSTSSAGDLAQVFMSTWPRQHGAYTSDDPSSHRKAAIRKHYSHPRDNAVYAKPVERETTSPGKKLSKHGSRSKFYVDFPAETLHVIPSYSSTESFDPLPESDSEVICSKAPVPMKKISRSASDPFILVDEQDVFNEGEMRAPVITVQCPSPRKEPASYEVAIDEDADDVRMDSSVKRQPRRRNASETITTIL